MDVNTASAALLSYISGINKTTAKNIVAYREANGRFRSRRELLKVPKLGPKAFEQCAGFLRITGGSEPLDMTAVHPESYDAARIILKELGYTPQDIAGGRTGKLRERVASMKVTAGGMRGGVVGSGAAGNGRLSLQQLSRDTGLGEYTLQDVLSELAQPGRDPRLAAAGDGTQRHGQKCRGFRRLCGYRRASGRPCAYLKAFGSFCEASAGCCSCR